MPVSSGSAGLLRLCVSVLTQSRVVKVLKTD
jgi:hypothetical protein